MSVIEGSQSVKSNSRNNHNVQQSLHVVNLIRSFTVANQRHHAMLTSAAVRCSARTLIQSVVHSAVAVYSAQWTITSPPSAAAGTIGMTAAKSYDALVARTSHEMGLD